MSLRIIDANLNRAREGLRTCEEYARLVLNDARASDAIKKARRHLEACVGALGDLAPQLIAARDIEGDVGVRPGADDVKRTTEQDIAAAGIKRAQEALRVIEEFCQLHSKPAAAEAAKARYAAYAAEQQVFAAAHARAILHQSLVMVIFAREACKADWRETLDGLVEGGARLFQIREKDATARDLAAFVEDFLTRVPRDETCVLINDRADVALRVKADGVHLGQDDLDIATARKILGASSIVGQSTHNLEEARHAEQTGADYVGLGAMFHTRSKKVQSQGSPALLAEVLSGVSLPVFPIGGIDAGNVSELIGFGARHVAVSSALLGSDDPCGAFRALTRPLREQA